VVVSAVQHISIQPIDGWGYFERDHAGLKPAFEADVREVGPGPCVLSKGWAGCASAQHHAYSGKNVILTPRHTEWDGVVVLHVHDGDRLDEDSMIFSGMADAIGLECGWL
jgi:hypothetical protein